MRPLDRTKMAKKYQGQWVALKADRKTVVGAGSTVEQAVRAAQDKGCKEPIVTRMPKAIHSFVGLHWGP